MTFALYVYVDGSDLHEHAPQLAVEFGALAQRWKSLGAFFVNQLHERTPDMQPDDLADWFLGVNLPLQAFGERQAEELLLFLRGLAQSTGREFVIGIAEESGITQDWAFVRADCGERERQSLLQLARL